MRGKAFKWTLWMWIGLWIPAFAGAQTTRVHGHVFDGATGSPLPYVNLAFSGSGQGTTSRTDGSYDLRTENRPGRLQVSFIGYTPQSIDILKGVETEMNIALEPREVLLGAAEVRPDEEEVNPAIPLFERIRAAKSENDPSSIPALRFNSWSRIELDINDIQKEQTERWYWGPFRFAFNYMDSTEARPALPLLIGESLSTHHLQSDPRRKQETVHAAQLSGLGEDDNPAELNSRFPAINLYENRMLILDRAFTSPLHDRGQMHYRYYILDTVTVAERPTFHFAFVPRRRGELTFEGEMWIDTLSLGLVSVEAKISEGANVNYVRSMTFEQHYTRKEDHWVPSAEKMLMDFSLTESSLGVYLRRNITFSDHELATNWPDSIWKPGRSVIYERAGTRHGWDDLRPGPLNHREAGIYEMVDSITAMRAWRLLKSTGYFLGTGYIQAGPLELGAWWSAYSYNPIEGDRWRLDVQTSNTFSKKWLPGLYAAYGRTDGRWKGGIDLLVVQRRSPRTEFNIAWQRDMEQFGMGGALGQGELLTNAIRTNAASNLSEVERFEGSVFHEFGNGFTFFAEGRHRQVAPRGELAFLDPETGDPLTELVTAEVTMSMRWANGERFVAGQFDRVSLGTEWPVVTATMTKAFRGLAGSQYNYTRMTLSADDKIRLGLWGRMEWFSEAGLYTGSAPFPFLEVVPAAGIVLYSQEAFNLLNFYELIADRWWRSAVEWHAEGLIFNFVPGLRRLKFREVIGAKLLLGSASTQHETLMVLPASTQWLNAPYCELNAGIENILGFLRLDYVMRLDAPSDPERPTSGFRVGFSVEL
ncbi:MAG: DUF5686 family protein [Flavobacteriales bacterium]